MTSSPSPVKPLEDHLSRCRAVCEALRDHRSFLIVGHIRPDGDCLGSQVALGLGLRALGKDVRIFNPGPIMNHLLFIPQIDLVESALDPAHHPEATIFCDCGGVDRPGEHFHPVGTVVNIDHHLSNDDFGDINWVNTDASSTGEMVYQILRDLGVDITEDMAVCLYLALMADTGSFKFANTNHRVFEIVTDLVRLGANPGWVASQFYDALASETLHLKGQVLSDLHFECEGQLCWGELTQAMYMAAGDESLEPEGLVSELRSIEGVEVAIPIHEIKEGGARAGLRSRGAWDVNLIARELGGGGHRNASGCFIRGDYPEVRDRIIAVTKSHLSRPAGEQVTHAAGE